MAKKSLIGLIVITAAVFALIYVTAQMAAPAAVAVGLGVIWLLLEVQDRAFAVVFFLAFAALAILGSLYRSVAAAGLIGVIDRFGGVGFVALSGADRWSSRGRGSSLARDQASTQAGSDRWRWFSPCAARFVHSAFDQLRRSAAAGSPDRHRAAAIDAGASRLGSRRLGLCAQAMCQTPRQRSKIHSARPPLITPVTAKVTGVPMIFASAPIKRALRGSSRETSA